MVRKGGFEPPRLSAPPPQDGVSASSTTSALIKTSLPKQHLIIAKRRVASRRVVPGNLSSGANPLACAEPQAPVIPVTASLASVLAL